MPNLGTRAALPADFRADVNGLRALAVSAVLLFHFNVPGFAGGFAGVDVFFVISGYLMTSIISRRLHDGNFSIGSFYRDRLLRIAPALVVLCGALLVFGWFYLHWYEYRKLARHILIGPLPKWHPSLPEVIVTKRWGQDNRWVAEGLNPETAETDRALHAVGLKASGVILVSPIAKLCTRGGCMAVVPGSEELFAVDYGHLTPAASVYVVREILADAL